MNAQATQPGKPAKPSILSRLGTWFLGVCETTAKCLNRLRIIPRLIVFGYGWLIYDVVQWYMAIPDPSTQQAGLLVTLIGVAAPVFGFYMQGGISGAAIHANGQSK